MGPEEQEKNVLYIVGGDGTAAPLGEIRSVEMQEAGNPFGEPYSLGMDLLSNAFTKLELAASFTAAELQNLLKAFGIKRKHFADIRRRESARRYRERKALKRERKQARRHCSE